MILPLMIIAVLVVARYHTSTNASSVSPGVPSVKATPIIYSSDVPIPQTQQQIEAAWAPQTTAPLPPVTQEIGIQVAVAGFFA